MDFSFKGIPLIAGFGLDIHFKFVIPPAFLKGIPLIAGLGLDILQPMQPRDRVWGVGGGGGSLKQLTEPSTIQTVNLFPVLVPLGAVDQSSEEASPRLALQG